MFVAIFGVGFAEPPHIVINKKGIEVET